MKKVRNLTTLIITMVVGGCSLNENEAASQSLQVKPCWLTSIDSCHQALPVATENVVRLTAPPGVDAPIGLVEGEKEIKVVYSHENKFDGDRSEIRYVSLGSETQNNALPKLQKVVPDATKKIRGSGSLISSNANHYLYYIEADKWFGKPGKTYRARLVDGQLTHMTPLNLQQDIRVNGWPKWHQLNSGEVAMVYRAGRSELFFALSKDGVIFEDPIALKTSGAMQALGEFADKTLIYTYQKGRNYKIMQSYFQLSKDKGKTWSERKKIASEQANVHDATIVTRRDGNIDAYYVYPPLPDSQSFSLFRRCIDVEGNLGPEQQVIETRFGNVAKPKVSRLANGHLMVMFTEQGQDVPNGDHSVHVVEIAEDANCPALH